MMFRPSVQLWLSLCLVLSAAVPAFAQQADRPSVELDVYPAADGVRPGDTLPVVVRVRLSEGWHMNAHEPLDEFLVPTVLSFDETEGMIVDKVIYPEPEVMTFEFSPDPMAVYENLFDIGAVVRVSEGVEPGSRSLQATLRWQACNDTTCWMPQQTALELPIRVVGPDEAVAPTHGEIVGGLDWGAAGSAVPAAAPAAASADAPVADADGAWAERARAFEVSGQASGYLNSDDFLAWLQAVEAGEGTSELGMFEGRSLWVVAILTLLGGLALNLTPCVLPLIPINLAIIGAGAKAGSRSRGFTLGGLYGVGIALVYGILGLVVVLGTGTFGAINASPWFNLAIAAVFVVLALAMFDVFFIDFSRFQGKLNLGGSRGSYLLAFVMGCVIALLAGACIAPVVIAVILLSRNLYVEGSVLGLMLPFLLGVGMALPWPFAGAGLSFLPKPGRWMDRVKYAFGVLILGFAAWYAWIAIGLFRENYFVDREAVQASAQAFEEAGWHTSLDTALAVAQEEGKPVFIDFWATWCKSCMTMNNTTFKDEAVLRALDGYVKVKYQAERPGDSPAREVLDHFGVSGLPAYRIIQPKA